MPEWKTSYGGHCLKNARLLTKEEIDEKYPINNHSNMAKLTREYVKSGYDILYGENPNHLPPRFFHAHNWCKARDILMTAASVYDTSPENIIIGPFTDMSEPDAIYAAVKLK